MHLSKRETENIINHFGKEFYQKVLRYIEKYTDIWKLSHFQFVQSYSINCIFKCSSALFGDVVVKIGTLPNELIYEINALEEYKGRNFCEVYDFNVEDGILVQQQIQPGKVLWDEESLEKRVTIFCSLYKNLYITPNKADNFPTYTHWVNRISNYMSNRNDYKDLYLRMKRANEIYLDLSLYYDRSMLLHGDLHHENILLGKNHKYYIIDPKGVIGDPIFDIGMFIINEYDEVITNDTYKKINQVIELLEKKLNIPHEVIRKSLFIQTTMSESWNVEDGINPHLDNVLLAEKLLNY